MTIVYNVKTKRYWSWVFDSTESAFCAIKQGHNHNTEHLAILDSSNGKFEDMYIDFGNFARNELGMQSQYAYHALVGIGGYEGKYIGRGIRYVNLFPSGYHSIKIHKDDALIFKERIEELS